VPLPRSEQQSGGKEDDDQVDAAAGMNINAWVEMAVAAQEGAGLPGEQPWQLGRIAAKQHRLAGRTRCACVRDTLVELKQVGVAADDGGGMSPLPDRRQSDRQAGVGAARV
jgi:hypothetical protein